MKKSFFFLLICLINIFWVVKDASPSALNFNFDIRSHHLNIQIDPSQHLLKAEDRLEIYLTRKKGQFLSFLLHPKLKIIRVVNLKTGRSLRWSETLFSTYEKRLDIYLKGAKEPYSLSISYEGQIYDPVVKEDGLQFVRGDQTSGLISPEGVYLSSSTHWYPDRPDSMARFEVEATISEPFRMVTQGELLSEELKDGFRKSKWIYSLPTESLTLVAGKYSVRTRGANGVKISTYFFPEDDRFSEIFITAAEEYLKIYSDLLGQYPYKKFDIVQNIFSSGYGIPTFTLLAPEAIRQGKEFLRPGALDHEIVHSWWGHFVSGKPETGNWVEALTTYCTNYYYKELKMGKDVAQKHRQEVMQKYAIQVSNSKDYALRRFEEKREELDGHIGYGKGSMVFHMLRQTIGEDLFFPTLKKFSQRYGGKQASWDDIQGIFEEASGKRLNVFFSQWLDRSGGPQLKLENMEIQVSSKGYRISGEVIQEGDIYQLSIPIEIDDGIEKRAFNLEVSKRRNSFSTEIPKIPMTLTVDPNSHFFRRLYPEEINPGLNVLLEDHEKIFVISDHEDDKIRKVYFDLAKMAKEKKGGEILSVKEMTEEKILNSSLMLLGDSWKNPIFSKLISKFPHPIQLKNGTFFINGKKVGEDDETLLLTYPHPFCSGKWVTIYSGSSVTGLSRARYIFFYGWDSYILFKKGRPAERGIFSRPNSPVFHDFLSKEPFNKIQPQRLKDHIYYLSSPEMAGRFPGTPGYDKAKTYLIKHLEEIGIRTILQPFSISVKDIEEAQVTLFTPIKDEKFEAIPFIFSKPGEWIGPCLIEEGEGAEGLEDIQGKAILVTYCSQCHEEDAIEFLSTKIIEYQFRGASAILFLIKEEDLNTISPYITYPSYFPPVLKERLKKREKEGDYIHRLVEAAKTVAMGKERDLSLQLPVLFIRYSSDIEEKRIKNLFNEKDASMQLGLRFKEVIFNDANIGGIIEGRDSEKKMEFLILGAHYDHLGRDEKSGSYYPGADDNASGISALLETGRSLMERRGDLKRSILLLFFGGEELGLRGSQHFVENPFIPLTQIKAMFSADSVGGSTDGKEIYFVGSSISPRLAQRSRRFLQRLGIKEGREIDRYPFHFGSDHYPFHAKGIPSLGYFASDDKKLHTLQDNLESIDIETLADVTRLIYLTAYEWLTEP